MVNSIYDKELVDKWLETLESGQYKQGIGALRSPFSKGYCCYGVLCDIIDNSKWDACDHWDHRKTMPPNDVMSRLGFLSSLIPEDGSRFAVMNDTGHSFKDIAKAIRKFYNEVDKKIKSLEEGPNE